MNKFEQVDFDTPEDTYNTAGEVLEWFRKHKETIEEALKMASEVEDIRIRRRAGIPDPEVMI